MKISRNFEYSRNVKDIPASKRGGTRIERVNPCCLEIFPIISPGSGEQGDVRINQKSIDQKFIFPEGRGDFREVDFPPSRLSPSPVFECGCTVGYFGRLEGEERKKRRDTIPLGFETRHNVYDISLTRRKHEKKKKKKKKRKEKRTN